MLRKFPAENRQIFGELVKKRLKSKTTHCSLRCWRFFRPAYPLSRPISDKHVRIITDVVECFGPASLVATALGSVFFRGEPAFPAASAAPSKRRSYARCLGPPRPPSSVPLGAWMLRPQRGRDGRLTGQGKSFNSRSERDSLSDFLFPDPGHCETLPESPLPLWSRGELGRGGCLFASL